MDGKRKKYRVRLLVDMGQTWGTWVEVEATNANEARAKAVQVPLSELSLGPVSDADFEAGLFADDVQIIDQGPGDASLEA